MANIHLLFLALIKQYAYRFLFERYTTHIWPSFDKNVGVYSKHSTNKCKMQTTDNVASQISLLAVLMLADGRKITADVVPGISCRIHEILMYAFSVIRKEEKGEGGRPHKCT